MSAEGGIPPSLGFGAERHIEKSRSASDLGEKVEQLTCAVEALLLHLNHLEADARSARETAARVLDQVEAAAPAPMPHSS
jgi:hypothetical protein